MTTPVTEPAPTVSTATSTNPASGASSQPTDDGAGQYRPTALSRQTGLITCLVIAAVVAVMVVSGLVRASHRPDRFTEAQNDLTAALVDIPFSVRLPQPVPDGARLVGVIVQEPDDNRGPSVYAIETTYTVIGDTELPNGAARYVRVWQTNDVYIRKRALDPLGTKPSPTDINGLTWYRRSGENQERDAGVSYTTRFNDGITMVVSGPDEQLVLDTINVIATLPAS